MRKFNEKDYEAVKAYEKDFTRAIESRYCTGLLQNELDTVQRIYNECLNRQANLSCGGCVLQMMTSVGRLYFGYLRDNPVVDIAAEEEITPVIEEVIPEDVEHIEEVTELIEDDKTEGNNDPENDKTEGNDNPEEKPKKERKPRKSTTNEDKTEHQTGEGMPAAL